MEKLNQFQKIVTQSIIFLLIGATLMQSKVFLSPFAFSYYGYHLVGATFAITVAIVAIRQPKIVIGNIMPLLAWFAFMSYSLFNGYVINANAFNFGHIAFCAHGVCLLTFVLLLATQKIDFLAVARILTFYVLLEGVLCLAQYFDWIMVRGKLFEVYGSLPNPNYTAMFLAMSLPALLYIAYCDKVIFRYFSYLGLLLFVVALALLQCRSAIIGALIGTSYFLAQQYDWKAKIINLLRNTERWKIGVIATLLCLCLFTLSSVFYSAKQTSSEGRLLIWKISASLGMEKPLFGHGTYTFEKVYNLAQSAYFQSGKATENEIYNAAHVRVPYNDYLLTFVEGGIVGSLFFLAFIVSLLATGFVSSRPLIFRTAYAGVLTFSIMALFNSQIYITAIMAVLMFYVAVICSYEARRDKSYLVNQKMTIVLCLLLFCFGIFFFRFQYNMALASRNVRIASGLIKKEKAQKAIVGLEKASKILYFSDQLWVNYAWAFQTLGDYQQALNQYVIAEKYSSDPEMLLDMAFCYTQLGSYEEAIQKVTTAINIAPNRIKPRYALMNVYLAKKDTLTAKKIASEIIAQVPKGISKDAAFYKEEAQKLLNH